jgi:hypothetical protein
MAETFGPHKTDSEKTWNKDAAKLRQLRHARNYLSSGRSFSALPLTQRPLRIQRPTPYSSSAL